MPVETVDDKFQPDNYSTESDENGRYKFDELPDGRYYLGTRLNKNSSLDYAYPRSFYPGTADMDKATIIEIHEGLVLQNYDFQLPPPAGQRTVRGRVTLPKGFASERVSICAAEGISCQGRDDIKVNADGTFKFPLFNGIAYVLRNLRNESGRTNVLR